MDSHIYLDESGDLGWVFDKPYRAGGSSRYLTIGFLICESGDSKYPKRLVKDMYSKYGWNTSKEKKATDLSDGQKEYIAAQTIRMLAAHPGMHLGAITVRKENVSAHIRIDGNKLYNYMIKLGTLHVIQTHATSKLVRDNRTVKVESGNSCIDYLQTTVWFEHNSMVLLSDFPTHSHMDDGIIFIDWITNIVWKHFEDGQSSAYNILVDNTQPNILTDARLYFR
jgi:hypothetical protein